MEKNEKLTMNERVYTCLRDDILKGRYQDGQQLRQYELAAQYNVSRIPVREALMQLSSEGLVSIIPYKGAVVASFSIEELHEIFEIRYALESLMLRYVVDNMTDQDAERIHQVLLLSTQKLYDPDEKKRNMNWDFHKALYEVGRKERLMELIEAQYARVDRYIKVDISLPNVQEKALQDHEAILEACRAGDTVEATVLLHEHMCVACDRLNRLIANATPGQTPERRLSLIPPRIKRRKSS
jgi:DNA-binding GntR family transcriptional regulator